MRLIGSVMWNASKMWNDSNWGTIQDPIILGHQLSMVSCCCQPARESLVPASQDHAPDFNLDRALSLQGADGFTLISPFESLIILSFLL